MRIQWLLIATGLALAACGGSGRDSAAVNAATLVDPLALSAPARSPAGEDYRIGATDLLSVTVFQVPDLSLESVRVDVSGKVELPLIGSVEAAGLTPTELSTELEARLGERYLRNPQVSVTVVEAASQKITVDGAVSKPGVYAMRGRTTLMQAVAMAEGPTRTADLESVAVFREIDGRRAVAIFDLQAIRNGSASDPVVLGDDVVVVDTSRLNSMMRDAIALMPAIAAFQFF